MNNINKYIDSNNNDPEGYLIRAKVFYFLGSIQQSNLDYDKAIELQPDNPEAYSYRANNYRELNQYKKRLMTTYNQYSWILVMKINGVITF